MSLSVNTFRLNELTITPLNSDNAIDLSNSLLMMDYYEDLLSPVITMKMLLASSSSLVNILPIRGGEKVNINLSTAFGDLIFSDTSVNKNALYVYKASGIRADSTKEVFILELTSREAITNETTRCVKRYDGNISESVKKILKEVLQTEKFSEDNIHKTANTYSFIGNLKKPFNILTWLCPKSLPTENSSKTQEVDKNGLTKGVAGFFFYETKDGFNFKSVESLVSKTNLGTSDDKSIPEYFYTQVNETNQVRNEFKILNYTFEKNSDLIKSLNVGLYSNLTYFYNLYTNKLSTYQYNLKDEIKNASKLGTQDEIALSEELGTSVSRILFRTSDIGVMDNDFQGDKFNEGQQRDIADMAKSISRYNILFTQVLNMVVPCNVQLKAGDIIKAIFPKIDPNQNKIADEQKSGRYLIKEICHHIEPGKVVSSIKLIRDSYGLYGPSNIS